MLRSRTRILVLFLGVSMIAPPLSTTTFASGPQLQASRNTSKATQTKLKPIQANVTTGLLPKVLATASATQNGIKPVQANVAKGLLPKVLALTIAILPKELIAAELWEILKKGAATNQDGSISNVEVVDFKAESKLVIAQLTLDTENTQFRARWYGSITINTKVTSLATCTLQLRDIHLKWDREKNTVLVTLPEITVDTIQNDPGQWHESVMYTGIGKPFFIDSRNELGAKARTEIAKKTRSEAEKQLAAIRIDCIKSLQAALEEKLGEIAPNVHIRVE
ncbi:MAG TPA: hypothetical protein DCE55_10395 [Planctomycetaceae bacterium]|nr:hypothetical protein [Planctomycetaceae bacterium]